jgi:hypothetical protein
MASSERLCTSARPHPRPQHPTSPHPSPPFRSACPVSARSWNDAVWRGRAAAVKLGVLSSSVHASTVGVLQEDREAVRAVAEKMGAVLSRTVVRERSLACPPLPPAHLEYLVLDPHVPPAGGRKVSAAAGARCRARRCGGRRRHGGAPAGRAGKALDPLLPIMVHAASPPRFLPPAAPRPTSPRVAARVRNGRGKGREGAAPRHTGWTLPSPSERRGGGGAAHGAAGCAWRRPTRRHRRAGGRGAGWRAREAARISRG